jgi:hypothetical protein
LSIKMVQSSDLLVRMRLVGNGQRRPADWQNLTNACDFPS